MRSIKKTVVSVLISVMLVQLMSGCAADKTADDKTVVSIALWGDQLMENYAPWLEEQFPDVEFDFYSATNSTDYYNYLAEKDELPDIMTVRRFAMKDVEDIKDKLMDLSDTELANSYYQSYLRNYTYSDGTVNWLPASAEIDSLIINKTLFDEYEIEIPTDYESFIAACEAFSEVGITGYASDFNQDYSCMEALQGFSADVLSSAEGIEWRQSYESGVTNQLSGEVWLPVFERMFGVIEAAGMDSDSFNMGLNDVGDAFSNGELAMFRGAVHRMELCGGDYECMIIPFPGDTEEESYYMTYPTFQVAARDTEDEERQELILEIMEAMLSEDGLNHIIPGESVVAYNKDVEMTLDDSISNLEPYIEENRMYIRLASSDMFSVSQTVIGEMLNGEVTTAQEALDEFNRILTENENAAEGGTVCHIDTEYSREFTEEHGNMAASALYNTMREELGVDVLIAQSAAAGCDIHEGDYTAEELNFLINWEGAKARQMELTGAELTEYMEFYLSVKETRDSVCNDSTLPVVSGMEMELSRTDDGYELDKLTVGGEDIDADKTYTVISWDCFAQSYTDILPEAGFTEFETLDANMDDLISQRLVTGGGQLSEPTDYITLN